MTPALLACDRPRFGGSPLELGEFEAGTRLLTLVGSWAPLFQLIAGQGRLSGGQLRILGQPAEGAAASGHVGLLLADAPMPPAWTLLEVLSQSGRLLGHSRRHVLEQAREYARELGLSQRLSKPFGRLTHAEQRIAGIVSAMLGEPAVLALELPLVGLQPSACADVARALERALQGRRALLSVSELPGQLEPGGFVQASDELLFVSDRGLVARAQYADLAAARSYRVMLLRNPDAFAARLGAAGFEVRQRRAAGGLGLVVSDLAGRGTRPIVEAALQADAPIVELCALRTPAAAGEAQPMTTGA